MASLHEITTYIDTLLGVGNFKDYCPNGLQVEGRSDVRRLVTGVTASQALLEAAVQAGADAVLVHHGFFWKGEDACITGIKRKRIKCLLESDISLLAYHLPLDAHPQLGNNVQLAERLGLPVTGSFGGQGGPDIALYGELDVAMEVAELFRKIEHALGREPQHIAAGPARVRRIGWCSGAAQSYIGQAAELGLDVFISGEISEPTVHLARENGMHYFAAGHHATERYGVQALGQHLAAEFALEHRFIEIENPV